MKKYKFTRNPGLKLLAFVFAAFLWLIVVNIDNPVSSDTYLNVPVTIVNEDIITQEGNVYQVVGDQSATVTVYAKRQTLQDINADDIVATADIREMDTDTGLVPIKVTIPEYAGDYESADASPRNLQIRVEKTGKKVLSLTVEHTGTQRNGYILGDMTVNPAQVTITGSESMIERVDRAVASINIEGISKDSDIEATLVLYDADGNEVTNSQISNNLGEDGITVHVEVLPFKTVPVVFSTSGTPAEGYQVTEITSEPETVQICGKSEDLADVAEIVVPASQLSVEGANERMEKTVDITPYLPDGISLVEENAGNVLVTVVIEEEGTRSVDFMVSSIRINNLAENLQVSYEPDAEITFQFSGSDELLDVLDITNAVSVDLSGYTQPGTYDVPVDVNVPKGITLVNNVTVNLVLEEKQNETVSGAENSSG